MISLSKLNKSLIGVAAACLAMAATAEAEAACVVTTTADGAGVGTLRYCVGRTNANLDTSIQVGNPGWYELNSTLVFTRSTTINGVGGVFILPGDLFTDVNLLQIGGACSPTCTGVSTVTLNNIDIGAAGMTDVRGILVNPSSGLIGSGLQIGGFDNVLDGGAIQALRASSVILRNSDVSDNAAWRGGAIFSQASTLTVEDSTFADNTVTGDGGAILVDPSNQQYAKVVTIDGSEFLRNHATSRGGAVNVVSGVMNVTATIIASDFMDNTAGLGGALSGAAPITDSYFQENVAQTGGALSLIASSTLSRNTFNSNSANLGGAVSFVASSATDVLTVNDSAFEKNKFVLTDNSNGGALYLSGGTNTHVVSNSTFYANGGVGTPPATQSHGGAIALMTGTRLDLVHSTLSGNAANVGGGLYVKASTMTVRSAVVSQSTGANCSNSGGTITQLTSLSSDATCGFTYNNMNPQLTLPAANGGPTRTMKPQALSPLINTANCYRTTDQRGSARPAAKCDIGSVEL